MQKKAAVFLITMMLLNLSSQYAYAAPKLPDVFGKLSEAAADVAEKAGDAKDAAMEAAGQAGEKISDLAGQAGEKVSEVTKKAGDKISEEAGKIGDAASDLAGKIGDTASEWAEKSKKTAVHIQEELSKAGVTIKIKASELGELTADKANELGDAVGKKADAALSAASGAADLVIDKAGNVIDMAEVGLSYVSAAAGKAGEYLQEKGEVLMQIAEEAVADIDLSDSKNWETARAAVDSAIENAIEQGLLDEKVDRETVHIITSTVFGTLMYGYQYSEGQITLGEYVGAMSEIIIKEGIPVGVGRLVSRLNLPIPNADLYAKEATIYVIARAYEMGNEQNDSPEADSFSGIASVESVLEEALS